MMIKRNIVTSHKKLSNTLNIIKHLIYMYYHVITALSSSKQISVCVDLINEYSVG